MADSSKAQPDASLRMEELAALVRQQAEAIQGLKTQLSKQIKREIANTAQQRLDLRRSQQEFEELGHEFLVQNPIAVLGECGGMPNRVVVT
jgi:hypothetical protein